jgi:glycine betaine/proline transport system permease protein
VLYGVTNLNVAIGFEGGLAVVLVAMFLDRITESLGKDKQQRDQCGCSSRLATVRQIA